MSLTKGAEKCERLCEQAKAAQSDGQSAAAKALAKKAAKTKPRDLETRRELAETLWSTGQHDTAYREYEKLVDEYPEDWRTGCRLAELYLSEKRYIEAGQTASTVLKETPDCVAALVTRGLCEEARQDFDSAFSTYSAARRVQSSHAPAALGMARCQLKRNRADAAAPLLREIRQQPALTAQQQAETDWLLGLCYGQAGRWSEAADSLERGLASRHATAEDYCRLAYARFRSGSTEAAAKALKEAAALDPADQTVIDLAQTMGLPAPGPVSDPAVRPVSHQTADASVRDRR